MQVLSENHPSILTMFGWFVRRRQCFSMKTSAVFFRRSHRYLSTIFIAQRLPVAFLYRLVDGGEGPTAQEHAHVEIHITPSHGRADRERHLELPVLCACLGLWCALGLGLEELDNLVAFASRIFTCCWVCRCFARAGFHSPGADDDPINARSLFEQSLQCGTDVHPFAFHKLIEEMRRRMIEDEHQDKSNHRYSPHGLTSQDNNNSSSNNNNNNKKKGEGERQGRPRWHLSRCSNSASAVQPAPRPSWPAGAEPHRSF